MIPDTVAEFVDQENLHEDKAAGISLSNDIQKLDSQKKVIEESGGCNQSVPVSEEAIKQTDQQPVESGNIRKDKEETIDEEDLGIIDEDNEIAEQLMSAPIDALELSQKLSHHEEDQSLEESFRVDDTGAIPFELHPTFNESLDVNEDEQPSNEITKEKSNDTQVDQEKIDLSEFYQDEKQAAAIGCASTFQAS